ncbi:MAG TPA: aminofutalosine synthase MqnE, partial [bacterium]|nr:aminofutalosine synthase MqnE [bacterium]
MKVAKDDERLNAEQGLHLLTRTPVHDLSRMATRAKERLHKTICYYNINRHIDYSNICRCGCRFCSFSRRAGEAGAFELTLD